MPRQQRSSLAFQGGAKITGLPPASANGEAVTLEQLNSAIEGLAWKDSVRVSTQGNLNLASPGASIDGVAMAANDRVLVRNQTTPAENGIYVWNGAAVAMTRAADASTADELEQATVTVEEGTNAGTAWRQTSVNVVLGSGAVTFVQFGTAAAQASESSAGVAALATQAETNTGIDDQRIVTPLKAALAVWAKRKTTLVIGDGSATQFTITHNFDTRDVIVRVRTNAGNYEDVECDVSRPTVNTVQLNFAAPPASNELTAVLIA